jgi:hypothetical protein
LVSASSASSSGGAASRAASSRSSSPVSDWLTSSWRSRDPRPLLLLGLQRRRPGPPPLRFEAPHHPQEGELDPLHLLGLADPVDRGGEEGAGPREVDFLHLLDQVLERGEAATQQQLVDDQAGDDGTCRDRDDLARREPGHRPGDHRDRPQQHRVDDQHLGEQRSSPH